MLNLKKKNGFTIVEVIVAFALTMIVVLFLFQIIIMLKNVYNNNVVASDLVVKQSNISYMINSDLLRGQLNFPTSVSQNVNTTNYKCYTISFATGFTRELCYDTSENTISYNDYEFKLVDKSVIGSVSVNLDGGNLFINIPITYPDLDGNYGIKAAVTKN